jgi:hypothetical protein
MPKLVSIAGTLRVKQLGVSHVVFLNKSVTSSPPKGSNIPLSPKK